MLLGMELRTMAVEIRPCVTFLFTHGVAKLVCPTSEIPENARGDLRSQGWKGWIGPKIGLWNALLEGVR